ncbi:unnamed protein product [Diamesa serratosioi]
MEPIVLVHGGAGNIKKCEFEGILNGCKLAAKLGHNVLLESGNVLDAVEAAVKSMELDELFNAGYGAVLTSEGKLEMEASIMNGKDLSAGCVTGIVNVTHPISVARKVMEQTPHNFLGYEGAMEFVKQQGIEMVEPGSMITNRVKEALEKWKDLKRVEKDEVGPMFLSYSMRGETVGAVAIDQYGNIAVATSTGGRTGKLPGRIGDTPLVGSGTYCDNNFGGVSTTGDGDTIMRACLAYDIIKRIEYLKEDAQKATENSCKSMTDRLVGTGGAITIDNKGNVGISFTSKAMAWAYQKNDKLYSGIEKGDFYEELIENN